MKLPRIQIGLFTLIVLPSLLVGLNWIALTRIQTEQWTYNMQTAPSVVEEVTSEVRLVGWPFSYNVAFPSESFGTRNMHWEGVLLDFVTATTIGLVVYWLLRRMANSGQPNEVGSAKS
jgi:hypothetical protein